MNKKKWQSMTDEQKTSYMRNVFKTLKIGDCFDYADCRERHDKMKEAGIGSHGIYQNPCIVLELVDPIMAHSIMSWMYCDFDENGNIAKRSDEGSAPLFGYNMVELVFNKNTLMEFSDDEKRILREAMRIIGEKTKLDSEQ